MTQIEINFKPEKFQEEVEILEKQVTNSLYMSLHLNEDKYSVNLYIGGEFDMLFADHSEEGISLSIYSEVWYYDDGCIHIKHVTENVQMKGIASYVLVK